MTQWHLRSNRKKSGKLLRRISKKKKRQRGRSYLPMHMSDKKVRKNRTRGGGIKLLALSGNIANIMIEGKAKKAKITTVLENSADSHFVRRNIITKGAIVQTDLGKARVTSRPGQNGIVNAVIIEQTPKASSSREEKK
jgi:small subunit ribosomal protein S8e